MSCYTSCATSQDYKNGWEFYGPQWTGGVESHQFEVGRDPILLVAEGLLPGQCIRIEWVSGCGAGDTFLPYVQGCCPATICSPQNRLLIAESGRYRMVLSGASVPDPTDISVFGRPQLVPPGYGDGAMSCCNEPVVTHVPAVINSADGVVTAAPSGTDNQTFALSFNELLATSEITSNVQAVSLLCTALTPCIQALIPPAVMGHVPVTTAAGDGVITITQSGMDNQTLTPNFNELAAVGEIVTNPAAVAALCSALAPCFPAPAPVTVTSADGYIVVTPTLTGYQVDFNEALLPVPGGTVFPNYGSPTGTVIIGGSGTQNVTLDVDAVSTADALVNAPNAALILCNGLKACITAGLQPQLRDCVGNALIADTQVALCSDIVRATAPEVAAVTDPLKLVTPQTLGDALNEAAAQPNALQKIAFRYFQSATAPAAVPVGFLWINTSAATVAGIPPGARAVWNGTKWDYAGGAEDAFVTNLSTNQALANGVQAPLLYSGAPDPWFGTYDASTGEFTFTADVRVDVHANWWGAVNCTGIASAPYDLVIQQIMLFHSGTGGAGSVAGQEDKYTVETAGLQGVKGSVSTSLKAQAGSKITAYVTISTDTNFSFVGHYGGGFASQFSVTLAQG